MQYPLRHSDYGFLKYDSFLCASNIIKRHRNYIAHSIVNGETEFVGNLREEHLNDVLEMARCSRLFSKIDKKGSSIRQLHTKKHDKERHRKRCLFFVPINHFNMNYSENQWTPAELEFLQAHYGTMPVREISAWLSKHTLQGIYQKASSIGLKRRVPPPKKKKARQSKSVTKGHRGKRTSRTERKVEARRLWPLRPLLPLQRMRALFRRGIQMPLLARERPPRGLQGSPPEGCLMPLFHPLTASTSSGESY